MKLMNVAFCLFLSVSLLLLNLVYIQWTLSTVLWNQAAIRKDISELVKKQANVLDKYAWKDQL